MIRVDEDKNLAILLPYKDYTFARELSMAIVRMLQNQKEWDGCTQEDMYSAVELMAALLPSEDEYKLLEDVAAGRNVVV